MTTRAVLISGKGGVGKTTVAAATAVRAAQLGHRTLVVSLDRAHNLGDVLQTKLGPTPVQVGQHERLFAMEADPQVELQKHEAALHGYFARFLEWAGVARLEAEEVAVVPGLEELLLLSRLSALLESREHDVVVVDLAPTASSLRLLSFPELMRGPIGKLLEWERRFFKLARPAVKKLSKAPIPEEETYDAIDAVVKRLEHLRGLLLDPERAVVRLVSIPERVVIDETRSAYTLLSLFGLCVDAVVLNRVLPAELQAGYLGEWTRIQARELERASECFEGLALKRLRFQPAEVLGVSALSEAAGELYGDADPSQRLGGASPVKFIDEGGASRLEVHLPHAVAGQLDLRQDGRELIITAGAWRRRFLLPAPLERRAVKSARLSAGTLHVHFEPQPGEHR